jgi:hypothetical protein
MFSALTLGFALLAQQPSVSSLSAALPTQGTAQPVPADFVLDFCWHHGSSPFGHDYTLTIPKAGPGRLVLGATNRVLQERRLWRSEFPVRSGPLQALFQLLLQATDPRCLLPADTPRGGLVGGPYVTLEAVGGGQHWTLQGEENYHPECLALRQQLLDAVTGMVPAETMARIEAERTRYEYVPLGGAEAVRWYLQYALRGYPEAMRLLGGCYAVGKGVAQDTIEAYAWFVLAVARRNGLANRDQAFLAQRLSQTALQEALARARSLEAQIQKQP